MWQAGRQGAKLGLLANRNCTRVLSGSVLFLKIKCVRQMWVWRFQYSMRFRLYRGGASSSFTSRYVVHSNVIKNH